MAYAYVNSTNLTQTSAASIQTASYTPTAGNSLLLLIAGTARGMPFTGVSGTGNVGDGVNTYTLLGFLSNNGGAANPTVTLTAAPSGTSGTLSAAFAGTTGTYTAIFSDGEWTAITLTNGSTAATWSPALVGTPTATVVFTSYQNNGLGTNTNLIGLYQAVNVAGTAVTPGAGSANGGSFTNIALFEYSGIAAGAYGTGFSWGNAGFGNGTNAVTTGNIAVSGAPGMLFGFATDEQSTTGTMTAGTSPLTFTGRATIWGSTVALPEDAAVATNGSYPANATNSNSFDTTAVLGAFFPLPAVSTQGSWVRRPGGRHWGQW